MTEAIDRTPICEQYKDKWVDLADDEVTVMGYGEEPEQALEMAEDKGHPDSILLRVAPRVAPMI